MRCYSSLTTTTHLLKAAFSLVISSKQHQTQPSPTHLPFTTTSCDDTQPPTPPPNHPAPWDTPPTSRLTDRARRRPKPNPSHHYHAGLRLFQLQPQCRVTRPGRPVAQGHQHRNHHCRVHIRRRCSCPSPPPSPSPGHLSNQTLTPPPPDRRRHPRHLGPHRRRQELREAPLHLPLDLVRGRRHRR